MFDPSTTTPASEALGVDRRPPGKVIVVMPAMNAATTLPETVANIPRDWVDEVILVDDHSSDGTVELARKLPLHVVWHPHNAEDTGPTRRRVTSKRCSAERMRW